jgi:23S rRNA (adenine2503-C2)-methyltransferase
MEKEFDTTDRIDIRGLERSEIEEKMTEWGEKKFRGSQIYQWLWEKGARSFEEMTNLSKALRQRLESEYGVYTIEEDKRQRSMDGTIKYRYKLSDGHLIESVLIPVPADNRYTVCVSSQVGCSLTCTFCATGKMKRVRNLEPGEIYDQVVRVNEDCLQEYQHPLTNIVYMGMGEPLLAYKNVLRSIDRITSPDGLGMSPRRITISTAGIAKMIKKLADDAVRVNLALSLHAADDDKRNQIMPINAQNNLEALMGALDYYYARTRNRLSFEYIAFQNFNDSEEDALLLARLCQRQFPVRVNIIEYNPVEGVKFSKSSEDSIDTFARTLRNRGVMVTVRRSRGKDIDAACGQLANKE